MKSDHGVRPPTKDEYDRHHKMVTQKPEDSDHVKSHTWPHKVEHSTHFDGSPVAATPTPQEHAELMKKGGHQARPDFTDPAVQKSVEDRLKNEPKSHEPKTPPQQQP